MTKVTSEIQIDTNSQRVWDVLKDLGAISNFNPYVSHSAYDGAQTEGQGAARVCEIPAMKTRVRETAVDWQEGESYTVAITPLKGKMPIKNVRGTLGVRATDAGSIGYMTVQYETQFGLLGKIMDAVMIRKMYTKMIQNIVRGLKHYAETGEVVDQAILNQLQAQPA